MVSRGIRLGSLVVVGALLGACGGGSGPTSSAPDGATSSIALEAGGRFVADGVTTAVVVVTVRDRDGNPLAGRDVEVACSGSGNLLVQPAAPTDELGVATATIASTVAETKTITAVVDPVGGAVFLSQWATVSFVADASAISAALSTLSASPEQLPADGTTESAITATIRDAHGNLVPGQLVELAATGAGITLLQPAWPTDASGAAFGTIASTVGGTKTVTATINAGSGQVVIAQPAKVAFVGGTTPVSTLLSTVTASPVSGVPADGAAVSTITVTVKDAGGDPLPNRTVKVYASGTGQVLGQPVVETDATGVVVATVSSTVAETKTVTALVDPGPGAVVLAQQPTVTFVASVPSAATSTMTASPAANVLANGMAASAITVTVRDANGNAVPGHVVQIVATGTGNVVTQSASPTDAAGVATASIASTVAGVKTLTAVVDPGPGATVVAQHPTVSFVADAGTISATLSTATASPAANVVANGTATSTITVTVRDANGNAVPGQAVQLASTGSGNTVTQPSSTTDALGVATGTIASTVAETKTLTATINPGPGQVVVAQHPFVTFVADAGAISAGLSSAVATPAANILANGIAKSTIVVVVMDANGNPVPGQTVQIAATGGGNTLAQPASPTDGNGVAVATLASTVAEAKTVTATINPGPGQVVVAQQPVVIFVPDVGTISATLSTATASPAANVVANGTATSTITVTVRDANGNAVPGQAVQLASTGSGNTLAQPASTTDAAGVATGTIASTVAETKTLTATINPGAGQVVVAQQPTVGFAGDPATISATLSTAAAFPATNVLANGSSTSTVTITVRDANGNPVAGQTVQIAATGGGNSLNQPASPTDASGTCTASLSSITAETKTLTVTVNPGPGQVVIAQQPTVVFIASASTISATLSTAVASPSAGVLANGTAVSTVTVTVKDANGNGVPDQVVQIAATGAGNALGQPAALTDPSGVAVATLASTVAEAKNVAATINPGAGQVVVLQQPIVTFVADPSTTSATLSTAVAAPTANVPANGAATSTVTVTVRDAWGNPIAGQVVQLAASGGGNSLTQPASTTDGMGVATGTLASTVAEAKTITATINPGVGQVVVLQEPVVTFVADPSTISATLSTAVAAPTANVIANGTASSAITVTVRDANGNPVPGQTVQIAATGTGNALTQPASTTDAAGVATASIASTIAEAKTITATINPGASQVVVLQQPVVTFAADASTISSTLSTAVAAPTANVIANGTAASTITVTVRDANGNPVPGQTVQIAATGTGNALTQPASITDGAGVATASIASTVAEAKTVTATINPGAGQVVVLQEPVVTFVADASTISSTLSTAVAAPTANVIANGTAASTITVTVRDANGNPVPGQTVQIAATGTGNALTQPASTTDAAGVATASIVSTVAEAKTITATINPGAGQVVVLQQPVVTFVADASTISSTLSTAVAAPTANVVANGTASSAITVTVRDANGNPVPGQTVQIAATGTGNALTQPASTTDAAGVATASIVSTVAEAKTITAMINPGAGQVVVLQQPVVTFVADASTISSTLSTAIAAPTANVIADGTSTSTITVTVRDANGNPVAGQTVQLASTGTGNTLTQPASTTDAGGVATGAIASTVAEAKTITATINPGAGQVVVLQQPIVTFVADASTISSTLSTAIAAPTANVIADGTSTSTITVTVRDANGNPVAGQTVQLASTGTGNSLTQPASTTDAAGVATGAIASTVAEAKTVTATINPGAGQVVLAQQPTVAFIPVVMRPSASLSTVVASPSFGVAANGAATALVTITVRSSMGVELPGHVAQIACTGAGNSVTQPANVTDGGGVATGVIASTVGETKTITVTIDPGPGEIVLSAHPAVSFCAVNGKVYYVRKSGSDSNAGTSPASAWLTIGKAAASMVAGDVAWVGAGTYGERASFATSGSSADPIRCLADPSGAHCADAGDVIVDAVGQPEAFAVSGSHVAIEDFVVIGAAGAGNAGIRVTGAGVTLRGNRVWGTGTGIAVTGATPWWSPAYAWRRRITFGTSHSLLPLGFTPAVVMDTRTGFTNVALASGNDVRVVWQPSGAAPVELNRIGSVFNSATTSLELRLQSDVPANADEDPDGAYFVYYGNASAGTPSSSESSVYWFADYFNRANSTTIGNGWVEWTNAGDTLIQGNALVLKPNGNAAPPQAGAKVTFPLGSITGDFRVTFSWNMPTNAEGTWSIWGMNVGNSATMVSSNHSTGVGPALFNGESLGFTGVEAIDNDMSGALENNVHGLHTFRCDVHKSAFTFDYWRDGVLRSSNVPFVSNQSTLDQYRVGGENFESQPATEHTIDDLKIQLVVANDPETASGSEEGLATTPGSSVTIEGNSVSSNTGNGVALQSAALATVRDNVLYANGGDGVRITATCVGASVTSNTLHANTGSGVYVDGAGCGATLRDNLATNGGVGYQVQTGSSAVTSDHNDAYGNGVSWFGLATGTGDLALDPHYVDADGADNVLGGASGVDDRFQLDAAFPSPALDAGSAAASSLPLSDGRALADLSSRLDSVLDGSSPDGATVNLGYHYPASSTALPAASLDDVRLFYGEGVVRQPRVRTWNDAGSAWSAEGAAFPAGSTIRWIANDESPLLTGEAIAAVLADTGTATRLSLLRWNGVGWSLDWTSSAIAQSQAGNRGFDVACEQSSGDVLAVYSNNGSTPRYRVRTAGTWSAETALPVAPLSGVVTWVQLAARPGSDEIALAYSDANSDLAVVTWDGASWVAAASATLETGLATNGVTGQPSNRAFDVAYETTSGRLMAAWGRQGSNGFWFATKDAGSTVWSGAANVATIAAAPHFVDLASERGGNRIAIAMANLSSQERLGAATWTGAAWTGGAELDSQIRDANDTATGDFPAAVAWVGTTGTAVCVYADTSTDTLDWARWTAGGGWVLQGDVVVAGKGQTESASLVSLPGRDAVMLLLSGSSSTLHAFTGDGTGWAATNGGTALETGLSSLTSKPFGVAVKIQ